MDRSVTLPVSPWARMAEKPLPMVIPSVGQDVAEQLPEGKFESNWKG